MFALLLDTKDDRFLPPFWCLGSPNGAVHWILTLDHQIDRSQRLTAKKKTEATSPLQGGPKKTVLNGSIYICRYNYIYTVYNEYVYIIINTVYICIYMAENKRVSPGLKSYTYRGLNSNSQLDLWAHLV